MRDKIGIVSNEPAELSEIQTAMNMIYHRIDMAQQSAKLLENKLDCVLRSPSPEQADDNLKSIIHTPLGQTMHSHIGMLDQLLNKLHDIEKRLEI